MNDADWQRTFVKSVREALGGGIDGWVDEALALFGDWSDVAVDSVTTSLTWYHTLEDRNAPIAAARRLVVFAPECPARRMAGWGPLCRVLSRAGDPGRAAQPLTRNAQPPGVRHPFARATIGAKQSRCIATDPRTPRLWTAAAPNDGYRPPAGCRRRALSTADPVEPLRGMRVRAEGCAFSPLAAIGFHA